MLEHLAPSFAALNPELFEKPTLAVSPQNPHTVPNVTQTVTHHPDGSRTMTLDDIADVTEDTPEMRAKVKAWLLQNRPPREEVEARARAEAETAPMDVEGQAPKPKGPPAWLLERFKASFWRGRQ